MGNTTAGPGSTVCTTCAMNQVTTFSPSTYSAILLLPLSLCCIVSPCQRDASPAHFVRNNFHAVVSTSTCRSLVRRVHTAQVSFSPPTTPCLSCPEGGFCPMNVSVGYPTSVARCPGAYVMVNGSSQCQTCPAGMLLLLFCCVVGWLGGWVGRDAVVFDAFCC